MEDRLVSDTSSRKGVEVQVLSSAPIFPDKEMAARLFREASRWRDERPIYAIFLNKQNYEDIMKWG